jgi:hypothetical protein
MAATDFTPGQGGYEAWAAAGKPTSSEGKQGNEAWQKALGGKSTKVSKTTGVSPFQTALKSVIEKIVKDATNQAQKATKVQTAEQNKAIAAIDKASNTSPEQAQKQQDEQFKALVAGMNAAKAQGTLPPEMWDMGFPSDVDAQRAAKGLPPLPRDKNGNLTAPVPYTTTEGGGGGGPPLTGSGAPYTPPSGPATGGTTPTPTGAQPTDKVKKLQGEVAQAQAKVGTKKGGGPFDIFSPGDWVDVAAQAAHGALGAVGGALDYASRPLDYVENALNTSVNEIKGGDWQSALSGWQALQSGGRAFTGHDQPVGGEALVTNLGYPHNTVLSPILGTVADIALDPTTYLSLGVKPALENALKLAPRTGFDVSESYLKQAAKAGTQATTTKAISKAAETQAKQSTAKLAQAGGAISPIATENDKLANAFYHANLLNGASPAVAQAQARQQIVQKILSDAAVQKLATLQRNAARDTGRVLDVKILGRSTNIGRNPIINVPFQALTTAGQKLTDTKVGQGIAAAFSHGHYFPGETQTLMNKANSMGTYDFKQTYDNIRNEFKGLTKAEKIRVADQTELGNDLSGELSKSGKDLGEVQKFMQKAGGDMWNERVNVLGKNSPGEFVPDHVFHYYQGGTAAAQKEARNLRKTLFRAGATGEDRFTLQKAADQGLKPVREADRIMVAQAADHQRQMVNEYFDRSVANKYGYWTDNPQTAKALGLVKVKPPNSAIMKPGMQMYLSPEVKKVWDYAHKLGSRDPFESNRLLRHYDQITRLWKTVDSSLRPGHYIRNSIGDIFSNFLDGVVNPVRYKQGLQMVNGNRNGIRIQVGKQLLNGDDIDRLWRMSGANQGFITSELMENKVPLAGHVLQRASEFSRGRDMVPRYAHFIDALVKGGKQEALGANNKAGLYKIATDAGRRVNKWNLNFSNLTPFEQNYMKRVMPFYTWMRGAAPLMLEAAATRPGRVTAAGKVMNLISNLTGVNSSDMQDIPVPRWLQDEGYARIMGGQEPLLWNPNLPTNLLPEWAGGDSNVGSVSNTALGNLNPLIKALIEQGMGRSITTNQKVPRNLLTYGMGQFPFAKDIADYVAAGQNKDMSSVVQAIKDLTGTQLYQDTETRQAGEVHRQLDPLTTQVSELNKSLGDYEVHKQKYGYSVYNKTLKYTEKKGFSTPEDAYVYALGLAKSSKG